MSWPGHNVPDGQELSDAERRARAAYKLEWDGSADFRQEFGADFFTYCAFRRAEERNLTSLFGGSRKPVIR